MSVVQQKGRLGRGLASLIGEQGPVQTRLPAEGIQRIVPIDHVQPSPFNPRKNFREEELSELADSIREKGLVQPLIVREAENNKYEIVAGERRWRAALPTHTAPRGCWPRGAHGCGVPACLDVWAASVCVSARALGTPGRKPARVLVVCVPP